MLEMNKAGHKQLVQKVHLVGKLALMLEMKMEGDHQLAEKVGLVALMAGGADASRPGRRCSWLMVR